jgi:hypothetical protein
MPEQRIKKYVEVIADFQPDGTLMPQTVIWDTGQRFDITNISEVMPRKYSKTGGVGVRYTCQIGRASTYLYYEVDKWFVEARKSATAADPC